MKSLFAEKEILYDGTQLISHFAYRNFNISGDSVIAFTGPVNVRLSEMADLEDVINREPISSDQMLSFIVELFEMDLTGTICLQRLLTALAQDDLNKRTKAFNVERNGDDLFYRGKKLSVSIATASPVSTLIHFALNTRSTGAPIPISSLEELRIDPRDFADSLLKQFCDEFESIQFARVKVNWVK